MATLPEQSDRVSVTAAPHPFRVERRELTVALGSTVEDALAAAQPDPVLRRHAVVEVGGVEVAPELYPYLRPKVPVLVRTVPAGGGDDKDPLRTALLIAVSVASSGIATAGWAQTAGGWFMAGSASAITLGATTAMLGRLLVNQIAPPPSQNLDDLSGVNRGSPTFSLEGARNAIRRYGVVPRVYGRHRFVPPYAAKPFTEVEGDHQYFRALFLWGYGPLDVTDVKIGETPITDFEEVEVETVGDNTVEGNPSLFSQSVDETNLSASLTNAAGFQQRTTADVADEISVDVVFPNGLFELADDGSRIDRTVTVKVEYAEAGTGSWKSGNVSLGARTLDLTPPGSRSSYAGHERTSAGLQRTYNTITYGKKVLVAVDAFDGTLRTNASSTVIVSADDPDIDTTPLSSVPKPSEPSHSYEVAIVELEGSAITQVIDLEQPSVTGFAVSKADADTVDVASGTVTERLLVVTEKRAEAVRRSLRIKTPDGTKQYDVRLRRETADSSDTAIRDDAVWTKLRAIQLEQPVTMEHVALTAIRIRASDQLHGRIDELNGIAQAIMDEYDVANDVWVSDAAASTPAAAFRNVLEGRANGRAVPTSRVDLAALESWTEFTVGHGLTFNHVFDYDSSVLEALDTIASVGRAAKGLTDGLWTVVVDEPKSTVVQHFTPRNTSGFRGEKTFSEKVHALRVRFLNEERGFQQDEVVVYNDGFTADGNPPNETPPFPNESGGYEKATRFEGLELRGVTHETQAFREGRYHLAVDELRPETYTFETDVEHLVATRGDRVKATHDVPQWGTGFGRVKSVSTNSAGDVDEVVLDAEVNLEAGQDYVARFRLANGDTRLIDVVDPGIDVRTDTLTPTEPISNSSPAVGDLAMIGTKGKESVDLLVKSIEPRPDLSARVKCLDYAPAVFDVFDEAIPEFDPRITEVDPFALTKPPEPRVTSIQSDEGVLTRDPDGGVSANLVVTFTVPSNDQLPRADIVQLRYRKTGSSSAYQVVEVDAQAGQLVAKTVDQGDSYDGQLRTVSRLGVASNWVSAFSALVIVGATSKPPDVTGFDLETVDQAAYLRWDRVTVFDLDHYEVRFSPLLTGVTWGTATRLRADVSKDADGVAVPGRVGTYLVKAVDRGGRKSENAAAIVTNASEVRGLNVVELDEEDPDFSGTRNDVIVVSGTLRLGAIETLADWGALSEVPRLDYGTSGPVASGTYFFDAAVDLGQTFTSRLTVALEADAIDLLNTIDAWNKLSDVTALAGSSEDDWDVTVEARTTDDDPTASSVTWSDWKELTLGDYTARAFEFRALLSADRSWLTPSVSRLEVQIDMPDRVEGADDVVVSDGQLTVGYDPPFRAKPALGFTAEDLVGGEYVLIKNKTRSGFDVEIRDSEQSGDPLVSGNRSITWIARGYGREVTP